VVLGVEEEVDHAALVKPDPAPPPHVDVRCELGGNRPHWYEEPRARLSRRAGRLGLHRAAFCKCVNVPTRVKRLRAHVPIGVRDVANESKEAPLQPPGLRIHAPIRIPRADCFDGEDSFAVWVHLQLEVALEIVARKQWLEIDVETERHRGVERSVTLAVPGHALPGLSVASSSSVGAVPVRSLSTVSACAATLSENTNSSRSSVIVDPLWSSDTTTVAL
jgi:hypothetical protein